jgi:hypothetical protein
LTALLAAVGGLCLATQPPIQEEFVPDQVRAASAAVAVIGSTHPLAAVGMLTRGTETSIWNAEPPLPGAKAKSADVAPLIETDLLVKVRDKEPIADLADNPDEVRAYNYVMATASRVPDEIMLKNARRDLTYVHLFEDTEEYRGQLIYLEGYLKRLVRFEPSRQLKKEGIKDHYEGWIIDRRYDRQSLSHCLLFTELPPEIKPGENLDTLVRFAGYLFKRYRFRAGTAVRDAPLLMGRSISVLREERSASNTNASQQGFLVAFVVIGGITAGVVAGLAVWYRRTDNRIRERLARVRPPAFDSPEGREHTNGHYSR